MSPWQVRRAFRGGGARGGRQRGCNRGSPPFFPLASCDVFSPQERIFPFVFLSSPLPLSLPLPLHQPNLLCTFRRHRESAPYSQKFERALRSHRELHTRIKTSPPPHRHTPQSPPSHRAEAAPKTNRADIRAVADHTDTVNIIHPKFPPWRHLSLCVSVLASRRATRARNTRCAHVAPQPP